MIFALNFFEKAAPPNIADPSTLDSPILRLYGRYMLGADQLLKRLPQAPSSQPPADLLAPLDESAPTIMEKVRVVPLAAELAGVDEALNRLDAIDVELAHDPTIDAGYRRDAEALRVIYSAPADQAAPLDAAQRDELRARHGWFARVALSFGKPEADPDRRAIAADGMRAMVLIVSLFVFIVLAGIAGFVLFIVAAVLAGSGRIRPAFLRETALPPGGTDLQSGGTDLQSGGTDWQSGGTDLQSVRPPPSPNAFLESTVLFLAAFLLASFVAEVAHMATGFDISFILLWIVAALVFWPLSRGFSWPELRAGLGWRRGKGILVEMACGVAGHLAGLPIMALGLAVSILIITLTGTDATHPITNEVSPASPFALVGLFIMTTLWAPLVEEAIFRGALYTHLRMRLRALPAALIVGFIFAAIHPQGFGGIPVLTALGLNFCLMREWRGSLIAPMTAHALHNGLLTTMLVLFLA